MRDFRKIYLKQVARRLRCSAQERNELLAGLETEMAECCPGAAGLSTTVLANRFGTPADIAAELQQASPEESVLRYGQQKRLLFTISLAICGVAIACLILYLIWAIHQFNGRIIVDTDVLYRN